MSYVKENFLKRVIEVQDVVLCDKKSGCTQKWIYENKIKDKYHISQSTFNNYLSRNAKSELEMLVKEREQVDNTTEE